MTPVRVAIPLLLLLAACGSGGEGPSPRRGRTVYRANCIACHNPDPGKDGVLGPAVLASSRELIEARVLRAEYPPGYRPKRETHQMVPQPHLEAYIDDLALYLADPE